MIIDANQPIKIQTPQSSGLTHITEVIKPYRAPNTHPNKFLSGRTKVGDFYTLALSSQRFSLFCVCKSGQIKIREMKQIEFDDKKNDYNFNHQNENNSFLSSSRRAWFYKVNSVLGSLHLSKMNLESLDRQSVEWRVIADGKAILNPRESRITSLVEISPHRRSSRNSCIVQIKNFSVETKSMECFDDFYS